MSDREDMLAEVIRRLVAEFDPEAIYLFGSHAWGQPTEDSDLDLLVVVPSGAALTHQDFVRAHHTLSGLGVAADIVLKAQDRFERFRWVRASLEYKITREGRLLYDRRGRAGGPERVGARLAEGAA